MDKPTLTPDAKAVLSLFAHDPGAIDVLLAPMGKSEEPANPPRRGPVTITASMARQARDLLNLDASTMARMMGVSRASVFNWEGKGVLSGPACVIYNLILSGDLPDWLIPTEDTKGRVIPTAD